ncbi:MAG: nuclear transport factor 2 family protein [Acidobacteriota bacterium]
MEIEAVQAALVHWMQCLDSGNLDGMIATCHPQVLTVSQGRATTLGTEPIRAKFGPRISEFEIRSSFELEHIAVYDSFALVVGTFGGTMRSKSDGSLQRNSGRLVIGYCRDASGSWRMILDVDNDAAAEESS